MTPLLERDPAAVLAEHIADPQDNLPASHAEAPDTTEGAAEELPAELVDTPLKSRSGPHEEKDGALHAVRAVASVGPNDAVDVPQDAPPDPRESKRRLLTY